ncbi:MAG: hypothetical protein R3F14_05190 [Polyangiaceae bacterium]
MAHDRRGDRRARRASGQIRLVFLELPKYDASRPPRRSWRSGPYFFREADNLTMVPEVLAEHRFVDALEGARRALTAAEWDAYILAGIALQNERGALSVAERRGEARGEERGRQQGLKDGREQGLKDGREQGLKDGREQGLKDGREQALRFAIKGMCSLLAMNLAPEQTDHLDKLDEDGLKALFAHLQEHKAWP